MLFVYIYLYLYASEKVFAALGASLALLTFSSCDRFPYFLVSSQVFQNKS